MNNFRPNWISKPGDTISDILKNRKLSVSAFAKTISYKEHEVEEIISGKKEINQEVATLLESCLGSSASFWLNREFQYRSNLARIDEEKSWLRELPVKDMVERGWIPKVSNVLQTCLDFFGVDSIKAWQEKYSSISAQYSFRTSTTFNSDAASLAAWLRMGELRGESQQCSKWDRDSFIKALEEIKPLTRKKEPKDFLPTLIEICASCGVSVVILRALSGCKASGATKFLNKDKALLLLSFRHLSDDQFWFTFFHEAGHLILHKDRELFIEGVKDVTNDEEREANLFAGHFLIPHALENRLPKLTANKRDIIGFAQEAGISPGIVIGQLQHRGYFKPSYSNSYKRRYNWDDIDSAS